METSRKHYEPVAENFWFVFFAYFLAIAAWYAVSGNVFISSRWRTVAETRKRGQGLLFALFLGMLYLAVYVYYQTKSGDYKEVCLALGTFAVAMLHILRTVLGLWQLHVFKHWVIRSVRSMESLGYRIELSGADHGRDTHRRRSFEAAQEQGQDRVHVDADGIIVNQTIVGNRLSEGYVQCYLRFFTPNQKHSISNSDSFLMRAFLTLFYAVESTVGLGGTVGLLLFSRSPLNSKPASTAFLRPREPEELWVRWATVLISCAFPSWLADMRKSGSEVSVSQEMEYQVYRDRFAEDLLLSAALHCERDTTKPPSSFLQYHLWRNFPKLCSGTFCKQEFLKHACTTGYGLPFQEPHKHAALRIGEEIFSYAKYRSKLEEARGALPANEGEKLACLGIEELEWLSVFLSIEDWSIGAVEEDNEHEIINSVQSPKSDSTDIAIENLCHQLGLSGNMKGFSERFAAPFLKGKEITALWGNRNVLTLSAHVDNWLALHAGEQVAFMAQKEERKLFRNLKDKGSEKRNQEPVGVTEDIPEESIRLEKQRLMFQLAVTDSEFSHFEQSISFLGCSMENLRSTMAKWVECNSEEQSGAWAPTLGSSRVSTDARNIGKFVFHASKDFELCVSEVSSLSCWSQRYLQMRLLWELQNNLHSTLSGCGLAPNQTEAILLCILSFPAILVIASETERNPESTVPAQGNRNFCCIKIDEKPPPFRIEDCKLTLQASYGPQNVHIEVFFKRQVNESGIVVTAMLGGDEFAEGKSFVWEAWRDTFYRSLQSTRQWQVEHHVANPPPFVHARVYSIGAGICEIETAHSGIGPTMKVWKGWPPHRETLSKYEMMTDGLILERKKTIVIPMKAPIKIGKRRTFAERLRIQYVAVSYQEAEGRYLMRASRMARDCLRKAAECSVDGAVGGSSKGNRDLELIRDEISTTRGGDDIALDKAINMMTSGNPNREAIERATELLEEFYTSEATKAPSVRILESLLRPVRNKNWVQKIKGHYKALMTATRFDPIAAMSFVGFCSAVHSYPKQMLDEDGVRAVVIAILRTSYSGKILFTFQLTKSLECLLEIENEGWYYLVCSMAINNIEHAAKILRRTKNGVALTNNQDLRRKFMSFGTVENPCGEEIIPLLPGFKLELEKKKADAQGRLEQLFIKSGTYEMDEYASRALELYSQAADEGDLLSAYHLGYLFEHGVGVPLDWSRAMELCTRAMNGGIDLALTPLAGLYARGRGVARNPSYAVELFTRAIEKKGDIMAIHSLSHLLQHGAEGVPVDFPRAVRLLSRAAEEGEDVAAMMHLAFLLHAGPEDKLKDIPYAIRLYERGLKECAYSRAKFNLATLLEIDGVPANTRRAAALYKSVVDEADDAAAMFRLGQLHLEGTGVPYDAVRATQLFQRAIDKNGGVDSLVHLADVLMKGTIGVPQDPIRAVELYTRAIEEHGSGNAMFKLASLLEFGENGVPSDSARAFSLYNRAASEKNHDRAARRLRKIEEQQQVLEKVKHIWSK